MNGVEALTVGNGHACVVLHDSTAECWGANTFGQLGHATPLDSKGKMTPSTIPLVVQLDADPDPNFTVPAHAGWRRSRSPRARCTPAP